ncbi:MAG: replication factor C large subunit [Promethearchaeia archaeon]
MSSTKRNDRPWVEKYRPKSIKEMALPVAKVDGQRVDLAKELTEFINNFFRIVEDINQKNRKIRAYNRTAPPNKQKEELKVPSDKAAVLLEGPPGIGKTSIVYALANDLNLKVIETNASDTRTREALENRLKESTKSRDIMDFLQEPHRRLILIDEVDGIYGQKDRGAVPAIIELIENTQFPIIMCANEYKQSLQPLYKKVKKFEVHPLPKSEIKKIIKNILKKENITVLNDEDLDVIIEKNNGDLRAVINDLQGISQGSIESNISLLSQLRRDSTEEIFNLIRHLFQEASTLEEARLITDKSDVDYNFLYKWIAENIPNFFTANEDLANAYENLSIADEIYGRIQKNQYWGLLSYFYDLFAGGVVLSRKLSPKTKGFRKISFPRFITSKSLTSAEKSLIEKILEKYPVSPNEIIKDFLPFLKIFCSKSRKNIINVSNWLELDAREKKILSKS